MALAGIPHLATSLEDEERRGAADEPVEPPTPPPSSTGRTYPTDTIWRAEYSGSNPSWNPDAPRQTGSVGSGGFTYTDGSWDASNGREPTPGDQARLTFAGGTTLYAGRIDASDRAEMNNDDRAFDGVQNGVGSGYNNRPAMMNAMILTGVRIKDVAADPAVFAIGDQVPNGTADGAGPHLHSFGAQANSYWTQTTLRPDKGGLPDPTVDLRNDFLTDVVNRSSAGFGFSTMMVPYWPTFVDGVVNNGAAHSGYIGRPRGVAGIPNSQLPEYHGEIVPPPQGLRMFTFKVGNFRNANQPHRYTFAWPCCWDGEHEWLPGGAHMAFLNPDGTPPSTHPFVIPFIHWFVDFSAPTSLTPAQVANRQSAQVTGNAGSIFYGQRRDYWNYNNTYVNPHAEILLAWDPVFAEAVCWMINNYCGLGRVNQRGAV